jgi:uncharacterized 2Fe-2S/4Fe-4S cluster protein (DUF4445 family)
MTTTSTVTFRPDATQVEVPNGTTLLEAAKAGGVFINSLCGGEGVCGRCRVIVREGRTDGASTASFSHDDVVAGYVLACEARVAGDVTVEVPPETRLSGAPEYVESEAPLLTDVTGRYRTEFRLQPLVRKTLVELPRPSLENNVSDLQRLHHALRGCTPAAGCQMGLKVIQRLPRVLRRADWKVTAVTASRGPLAEIVDVEPGDTTRRNLCVAIDIGTTTVICDLIDMSNGQTLGRVGKYNSQAAYGADVVRRIIHASRSPNGETALRETIVKDINELIGQLTARYRAGAADITLAAVAGNTTMMHLLLGLPVENIRKEPYIGAAYRVPPLRAAEVGLKIHPRGLLYCLPCVAGFVGADVVAGVAATGMAQSPELRMLIDIGTNGEIVIGNNDFLICASASAGPAFEGAECRSGMRATRGAIDHIRLLDPDHIRSYSTVGSKQPVGICGTGYVDLVAEMLRVGVIDKTGRLQPKASRSRVREDGERDGLLEYVAVPAAQSGEGRDISISQGDVNNILRAKGAIYAAARVLLNALGMRFDEISEIMIAGAFGNYLAMDNAIFIGLLPEVSADRLRCVGNTSGAGARLAALSEGCYEECFRIADRMTYFELSTDPTFMDHFVSACFFPHTQVDLFPNVMAELERARR